ncbi:MAG: hypothetical protein KAU26_06750 [Methylococcales bacterium]|nr:hypothetical protein [Methylococcales bacterium]
MNKLNKTFIPTIGISLIIFSLLYLFIFDLLVSKDLKISHSYKNFLLKHTKAPRLIIESGSNSFHAINSAMLEKEFNLLTINLADNAGYPLKYKLLRIENYSSSGDIILLPLEWQYYSYQNAPNTFLNALFDPLNYYYVSLSWENKIKVIIKSTLSNLINTVNNVKQYSGGSVAAKVQSEYIHLIDYEKKYQNKEKGDAILSDIPSSIEIINENCNEFILGSQLKNGFSISSTFKENIKTIKRLQKKGLKIFFTWPAVAGEDCYHSKEFRKFFKEIKALLTKNNIPFISKPEKSNFPKKYILNTFYHITPKARDIRTQTLIQEIKESELSTWFKPKKITTSTHLDINSKDMKIDILSSLNEIENNQYISFGRESLMNNIFLEEGWMSLDMYKLWSRGYKSSMTVKLNKKMLKKSLKMVIEARGYKKEDQSKTKILVNGRLLGNHQLKGKIEIIIPQALTIINKGFLKIELHYINVKSPLEYGDSQDHRKFKLWITSLMFLII